MLRLGISEMRNQLKNGHPVFTEQPILFIKHSNRQSFPGFDNMIEPIGWIWTARTQAT